jgi:hypothetical protein
MLKFFLWLGAVVFAYFAWKSGSMHERTGDIAYMKEAIGWGVACLVCVVVAVYKPSKSGGKKKATAGAGSGW